VPAASYEAEASYAVLAAALHTSVLKGLLVVQVLEAGSLEGVVAFHSGEPAAAQQHLQAAQRRWQKLQVSTGADAGRATAACYPPVQTWWHVLRFRNIGMAASVYWRFSL